MCNACIMEGVKREMLSRRQLFTGAGAAAVTATAVASGILSAKPALAQASGRVVDLTHVFDPQFPTFDGKPGIEMEWAVKFEESGYQLYKVSYFEHSGTHMDVPLHFSQDGASVDQLDPGQLIAPLCVVDITAKAAEDANAMLEAEDIEAWVSANGDIPAGACVAMHSGWAARVGDTSYRTDADGNFAFPGFAKSATDLLAEIGAASIAVDTLSLDPGNSPDFAVHYSWLPSGHFGIENVKNLDQMPARGATVFIGSPTHRGGTGGLARLLAVV
ncbi:MAG: cyclase family protein [Rubellimicrobium sp.]|nr:cyclase family protein [Rubellimicrobium sp.]